MSHAAEFDEYGHKSHGHVIVSLFTLRFVLAALLVCTLATSGSAWAEQFISDTFHVAIPQWVNAAVALSIAIVKTVLVVMFFMQLKYDNPMNTIIFVFTLITVFSFLGFTSLDLGNRDSIDRFKSQYAYDGGDLSAGPGIMTDVVPGESIVERAKRIAKANGTYDAAHEHHHEERQEIADAGFFPELPKSGSSSNVSRPVVGFTLPGYGAPVKPAAGHGSSDHTVPGAKEKEPAGEKKAEPAAPPAKGEPAHH
jgi:cytochrome c oxidase subunit 4